MGEILTHPAASRVAKAIALSPLQIYLKSLAEPKKLAEKIKKKERRETLLRRFKEKKKRREKAAKIFKLGADGKRILKWVKKCPKYCKICGEQLPKHKHAYCSSACYNKFANEEWKTKFYPSIAARRGILPHEEKICIECGNKFVWIHKRIFCSKECSATYIARTKAVVKQDKRCSICGARFVGIPKKKYCSQECKYCMQTTAVKYRVRMDSPECREKARHLYSERRDHDRLRLIKFVAKTQEGMKDPHENATNILEWWWGELLP